MRREIAPELVAAAREAAAPHLGVPAEAVALERLQDRRPDRPIFRASAGGVELVTKQYLDDEFLEGSAARLAAVAPLSTDFEVPRLIGTERERRILLMTVVHGDPLLDRLRDDPDAGSVAERAGVAIGRLHRRGPGFPGARTREDLIGGIRSMQILDEDRDRFRDGFALAERLLGATPVRPDVPTHGDLGTDQMLVCGPRIGIIDFDKATQAEASRDLGYFVAQLLRDLPGTALGLWSRFLAGYGTELEPPPAAAIAGYAVLVLLRKIGRATAPWPPGELERRGGRPRRYETAIRTRPALDRVLGSGGIS